MPEDQIQPAFHEHPMNMHERVYGVRLAAGAVLNADTDVYDSSNGRWEQCPCPGLTLGEGIETVWIRLMPEPTATIIVQAQHQPLPPL